MSRAFISSATFGLIGVEVHLVRIKHLHNILSVMTACSLQLHRSQRMRQIIRKQAKVAGWHHRRSGHSREPGFKAGQPVCFSADTEAVNN
ncbi:MAG: hypothetical protein WAK03_07640, partial [Methylocystis sp.]